MIKRRMELSKTVENLIAVFEQDRILSKGESGVSVSRTVSALATLYEKARNAVEFRAEHLVRRAAIERILKRRIMLGENAETIAENLAIELMWAKYIDSSFVNEQKSKELTSIIKRYLYIRQHVFGQTGKADGLSWGTMLGLASSEIDEAIISPTKRAALVNFVYQAFRQRIKIPKLDEKQHDIQTYIAVERGFAQADNALISYHLLRIMYPAWFLVQDDTIATHVDTFLEQVRYIQDNLFLRVNAPIVRHLRTQLPPYRLIRDLFLEQKETELRSIIDDPEKLDAALETLASKRYHEIGAKVRRAVVRSIIYIFLTKMIFALALEAPYDLFVAKRLDYIPLFINLLFPPILLYFVAGFIKIPGAENTKLLVAKARGILHYFDDAKVAGGIYTGTIKNNRPILSAIFTIFYIAAFAMSFGVIAFTLTKLHFNFVSQVIFVFFVALVSIFAYRIRQSAKEYEVVEHQGILEPLIDFFFLPILHAGDMLSKEIAKINFFIFLFDFVLEAPLKVIFGVVEEWIRFIRMKKEEIL
ncbi:MAG: hypothetical protein V1917_00070 [Candidatus Gottesmanbacteria bacterium]